MTAFDANAERYDRWFDRNSLIFRSEAEAVRRLSVPGLRYAEIGLGTGRFACALGIREGLEPSEAMARIARARGLIVAPGRAERMPYPDASIPGLVMITADCYLSSLDGAFREARRALCDPGEFVVAFIDRDSPLGAIYDSTKSRREFYRDATFHSHAEIVAALRSAGLEPRQTAQTVFEKRNVLQEISPGHGAGAFCVVRATKGEAPLIQF